MTWFTRKTEPTPPEQDLVRMQSAINALARRLGQLELNEHGHCEKCGKVTPTGCMNHCSPDTPCPKARAA